MPRSATQQWLSLLFLGFEAQQVVALRLMRIAGGGALAQWEMQRMVAEKLLASGEAGVQAMFAWFQGKPATSVSRAGLNIYSKRVRANRRRLLR